MYPAPPPYPPGDAPTPEFTPEELEWTEEERALIDGFRGEYAEPDGAVMKTLWLAQEKFGWLSPDVMRAVAGALDMPYAKVYGVATFYTQYFKQEKGRFVLDVCTCFTCQVCGGYDILHYLESQLGITAGETTADGLFTLQEAECLGACGSAPMLQVSNGPYVHNLTPARCDGLLAGLRSGATLPFESVTLPQDEADLGGNRRSDAEEVTAYAAPPVAVRLSGSSAH